MLWLVSRGIPYERAVELDHADAMAHMIILGEIPRPGEQPMVWDWLSKTFIKA